MSLKDDNVESNTENSSSKKNESSIQNDSQTELLLTMLEKIVISDEKPFPAFISASEKTQGHVVADLNLCPFPVLSVLLPFPIHKTHDISPDTMTMISNMSHTQFASNSLAGNFPIFCPPLATMLTGRQSLYKLRIFERYSKMLDDAFDRYQKEFVGSHEDFLSSENIQKLRLEKISYENDIREMKREMRFMKAESWGSIQSTFSIFYFYKKVLDVTAATHGFTSVSNPEERQKAIKRIDQANLEMIEKQTNHFSKITAEDTFFGKIIDCMADYLLVDGLPSLPDFYASQFIKLLSNEENASEIYALFGIESAASLIQFLRDLVHKLSPNSKTNDFSDTSFYNYLCTTTVGRIIMNEILYRAIYEAVYTDTIHMLKTMEENITKIAQLDSHVILKLHLDHQPPIIQKELIDQNLRKTLLEQNKTLHTIRISSFHSDWQNSDAKPVLYTHYDKSTHFLFPNAATMRFFQSIITALAISKTSHGAIASHASNISKIFDFSYSKTNFSRNTQFNHTPLILYSNDPTILPSSIF